MTEDHAALRRKILSDRYNRIIFGSCAEEDIYLVGGYIRDLLLKRRCLDRDFVIRAPFEPALSRIASALGAKAVSIGGKGLFRIIAQRKVTLDFSPIREEIPHDLSKRDFTINAMAWTPARGIIDEAGGMRDLARKSLRMISEVNLRDDPVRVIRAYRIAAALSFNIDPETRTILKALAPLVPYEKRERITLEFFKILNLPEPERALRLMMDDGLLGRTISYDNKTLQAEVRALSSLQRNLDKLPLKYRRLLPADFAQNLSYLGFLRLSLLLRAEPMNILSLSSKIRRQLELNERARILYGKKRVLSEEDLFDLFIIAREAAPLFLITNNLCAFFPDYDRYLRVNRRALLPAAEIREITVLSNGKELGSIISALKKARFKGVVGNRAEAVHFVRKSYFRDEENGG
jgi:tRNA nucleotidyltransferase/poly(A) polymerase